MVVTMRALTADDILRGYLQGAFPMDMDGVLDLYLTERRAVIPLASFRIPRSVRRGLRDAPFTVSIDAHFSAVLAACGGTRQGGEWLTPRLRELYEELFARGLAHSVEVLRDGDLVGGLFGVALGGLFTSESMFHTTPNAGNAALVHTHAHLVERGYVLWDIQMVSPHTARFGACEIAHEDYRERLGEAFTRRCFFGTT